MMCRDVGGEHTGSEQPHLSKAQEAIRHELNERNLKRARQLIEDIKDDEISDIDLYHYDRARLALFEGDDTETSRWRDVLKHELSSPDLDATRRDRLEWLVRVLEIERLISKHEFQGALDLVDHAHDDEVVNTPERHATIRRIKLTLLFNCRRLDDARAYLKKHCPEEPFTKDDLDTLLTHAVIGLYLCEFSHVETCLEGLKALKADLEIDARTKLSTQLEAMTCVLDVSRYHRDENNLPDYDKDVFTGQLDVLEPHLEEVSRDSNVHHLLLDAHFTVCNALQDDERTLASARQLLDGIPTHSQALIRLVLHAMLKGDLEHAQNLLDDFPDDDDTDVLSLHLDLAFKQIERDGARPDSDFFEAWKTRILTRGEHTSPVLVETFEAGLNNYGMMSLHGLGEFEPRFKDPYHTLALRFQRALDKKDFSTARAHLAVWDDSHGHEDGRRPQIYRRLFLSFILAKAYEHAYELWEHHVSDQKLGPRILLATIDMMQQMGRGEEASKTLQRLDVSEMPKPLRAQYYSLRHHVYHALHKNKEVLENLEHFANSIKDRLDSPTQELDDDERSLVYRRFIYLVESGHWEHARAAYQDVLRLDPTLLRQDLTAQARLRFAMAAYKLGHVYRALEELYHLGLELPLEDKFSYKVWYHYIMILMDLAQRQPTALRARGKDTIQVQRTLPGQEACFIAPSTLESSSPWTAAKALDEQD